MRLAQDPFTITIDVEEYEGGSSRVEVDPTESQVSSQLFPTRAPIE